MNALLRPEPRVIVEENHALPLVSLAVAVPRGSTLDPSSQLGLSRLMARLMRRTAGGRETSELDIAIDSLGGSLSSDVGASTLSVGGTVLARNLDAFVALLVDVVARPSFAEAELARLTRETLAELVEARDDDRTLARRWFRRHLFAGHPFGRSTSGNSTTLAAILQSDVVAQHQRMVRRDGLHFAFSGELSPERAVDIADELRVALPVGAPPEDPTPEPSLEPGRRLVVVDKPDRTQTQILIGCLGTHPRDDDHFPLLVANTIFGGTFSARMTRAIRSDRGWSYGAYSSLPIDRRRQGFSMWTFPKADDAAACIALELELLDAWVKDGITDAELEAAQRYLVRSQAFSVDTASKRVGLALDTALYELPSDYYSSFAERVASVTREEANAAIRRRITPESLLITVVGTDEVIGEAVRGAIPGLGSVTVVPYDAE